MQRFRLCNLEIEWPTVSGPWKWAYQGKRLDGAKSETKPIDYNSLESAGDCSLGLKRIPSAIQQAPLPSLCISAANQRTRFRAFVKRGIPWGARRRVGNPGRVLGQALAFCGPIALPRLVEAVALRQEVEVVAHPLVAGALVPACAVAAQPRVD